MATNDERREVAARLRNNASQDMDWLVPWAVFNDAEQHASEAVVRRLADLIEPSCDRDALLALTEEMVEMFRIGAFTGEGIDKSWCRELYDKYARRIREALGVEP